MMDIDLDELEAKLEAASDELARLCCRVVMYTGQRREL